MRSCRQHWLNSRPLSYIYDLIFGRRLVSLPDEVTTLVEDDIGEVHRRFGYLSRMRKHFWKRWQKEFEEFHKGKNDKGSEGVCWRCSIGV